MFPIGDDDTSRRTIPLVTYALIAYSVGLLQVLHSWRLVSDQKCRIWEHQGRLRGCSALIFYYFQREKSEYYRANK